MNISLPESLKELIGHQVSERGYGTTSEHVRDLVRRERDRWRLRSLILEGGASGVFGPADTAYFESLRERVRNHSGE